MNNNITEEQVLSAQKGWCNGLLAISKAYATGGFAAANATATKILDQAYGYQYGATDSSGKLTTVDKTWAFVREPDGEIRIVLHHSSLPFVAK
jgi:hypothetical protein